MTSTWFEYEKALEDMGPVPWLPYEVIFWLDRVIRKDWRIFEWGYGYSSLFFAKRAAHVISVEHNPAWAQKIARPGNVQLKLFDNRWKEYERAVENGSHDLIVVDGRHRVECMQHAIRHVELGGFLILDNSDRTRYEAGMRAVPESWARVDVRGLIRMDPARKSKATTITTTIWHNGDGACLPRCSK